MGRITLEVRSGVAAALTTRIESSGNLIASAPEPSADES
jgi:hypothetical protein